MTSIVKNTTTNIVYINDLGYQLDPNQTFDTADVPLASLQSSIDLPSFLTVGNVVYLNADSSPMTITESLANHQVLITDNVGGVPPLFPFWSTNNIQDCIPTLNGQYLPFWTSDGINNNITLGC